MSVMIKDNQGVAVACICGCGSMVEKVGTITKNIRGKQISIHNVPFYECPSCGEREFDINTRLSSLFAEAYRTGAEDVLYPNI